jgi:hypothetical protein
MTAVGRKAFLLKYVSVLIARQTGFPVTSDPEAGASHRQVDHCGAVRGDRAHAKETWSQARLGEKRVALA